MKNVPFKLMQSLYLPAFIGSGFVATLLMLGELKQFEITDIFRILYGLLLVVYFSLSFLANELVKPEKYRWSSFFCDIIETTIVFAAFFFLGFLTPNASLNENYFYLSLAILPVIHITWNKILYKKVLTDLWIISVARFLLFITGVCFVNTPSWYFIFTFFAFLASSILYYLVKFQEFRFWGKIFSSKK